MSKAVDSKACEGALEAARQWLRTRGYQDEFACLHVASSERTYDYVAAAYTAAVPARLAESLRRSADAIDNGGTVGS